MPLPTENIKQAILHPEKSVRQLAAFYFAVPNYADPTIMPLVIEAFAKFGRFDAFRYTRFIDKLVQTEESIKWILSELAEDTGEDDKALSLKANLLRAFCHADVDLIAKYRGRSS